MYPFPAVTSVLFMTEVKVFINFNRRQNFWLTAGLERISQQQSDQLAENITNHI